MTLTMKTNLKDTEDIIRRNLDYQSIQLGQWEKTNIKFIQESWFYFN